MKKLIVFLLLVFNLNINASVYDFIRNKGDILLPFISDEIQKMHVRINDNKMDIWFLESNKSSKEVLDILYKQAEKNGCVFYSDESVFYVANLLYKIAGRKKYEDEFGYIFYRDKNDKITFIITAGDGRNCEIIKIATRSFKDKTVKGFNDGIRHYNDACKIFSIEILSESGRTIYFANFYRVEYGDRHEIRNFYNNTIKKGRFRVVKKYFDDEIDFFILERKGKNYLLVISDKQQENWIIVTG